MILLRKAVRVNKKKRIILSILLSCIILIFSKSFWLNLGDNINFSGIFDWKLFFTVLILSFLCIYKFFDYIANYKTIQHKSRADILFLFIFCTWLFIPMSHITKNNWSDIENRELAEYSKLLDIENHKLNYDYGKNFNNWFNERFCLRDELIKLYNKTSLALLKKNSLGLIDGDWCYKAPYNLSKTNDKDINALLLFNDFCKNNDIKLYILIVPEKNEIYSSKKFNILKNKSQEDFSEKIEKCRQNNDINIIYPYESMLKRKENELMFFKTEHHWTDSGAYIGYSELMKYIKKDYPNIIAQSSQDYTYIENNLVRGDFNRTFKFGTTCKYIGMSKKERTNFHRTPYKYWRHKNFDKLKIDVKNVSLHREKTYYYVNGADLRVILLGTSQSENLCEFIPFTFKNVKRLRNNNVIDVKVNDEYKIIKRFKKDILEYKPDIIIFCITRKNVSELHNMFNME